MAEEIVRRWDPETTLEAQQPKVRRKKIRVDYITNPGRPIIGKRPPRAPSRGRREQFPLSDSSKTKGKTYFQEVGPLGSKRTSDNPGSRQRGRAGQFSMNRSPRAQPSIPKRIYTGRARHHPSQRTQHSLLSERSKAPQNQNARVDKSWRRTQKGAPTLHSSSARNEEVVPTIQARSLHLLKQKVVAMGRHIEETTGINVTDQLNRSNSGSSITDEELSEKNLRREERRATWISADTLESNINTLTPVESPEPLTSSGNSTAMSFSKKLLDRAKVTQAAYEKLREPALGVTPVRPWPQETVVHIPESLSGCEGSDVGSSVHSSLQSVAIRCAESETENLQALYCVNVGNRRGPQQTLMRDVQVQVDDQSSLPDAFAAAEQSAIFPRMFSRASGSSSVAREMTLSLKTADTDSARRRKHQKALPDSLFEPMAKPADHHLPLINETELKTDKSLEEILFGKTLQRPKRKEQQKVTAKNVRANMGCLSLLLHDYKVWRRRRKYIKDTNPVFAKRIHLIEGQFGSGVVSFFIFVRWFLLHNLLLAILWLVFVVLPQALDFDYSIFQNDFYIRNILDGQNALIESWLFYGSYNETVNLPASFLGTYPLSLVYFLCTVLSYWGGLFLLLRSMALAYHDEGGVYAAVSHCKFGLLLFASWDYSLTSEQAASNLSMGIANSFRDLHHEEKVKQEVEARSKSERGWIIVRRCAAWAVTLFLIVGGCVAIMYVINGDPKDYLQKLGYSASDNNLLVVYSPTVIFIAFGSILPHVINQMPSFENYASGRVELYVTIFRVFLLRMAYLLALVVILYTKVEKGISPVCAGTLIGQNLYQLVMLDTIKEVLSSMLPSFAYYYWTMKKREFQIPHVVLKIVYRQALIWLGMLVCPVMPLIGVLSFLLFFHTHYIVVSKTCEPPSKRWNQPRRSTFFMGLMVATLIVLIIPISLIIGSNEIIELGASPNTGTRTCGPFENRTMISELSLIKERIVSEDTLGADILGLVTSNMTVLSAIFIALSLIYFQHLRVTWEKRRRTLLLAELDQERKQAKQLQKRIHQLLQDF